MALHDGGNGGRMIHATQERELWAPHGATTQRTTISRTQRKEKNVPTFTIQPTRLFLPIRAILFDGRGASRQPTTGGFRSQGTESRGRHGPGLRSHLGGI